MKPVIYGFIVWCPKYDAWGCNPKSWTRSASHHRFTPHQQLWVEMATIKPIEGKSVCFKFIQLASRAKSCADSSNTVWSSHRWPSLGRERARRKQFGCGGNIYRWFLPTEICETLTKFLVVPDVRFKNYGLDAIEVQDSGSGIAPEDFESIGKPTSLVQHVPLYLLCVQL